MPARTFLYGFLGFIAVASAVTMFSDPLDPEVGNGSSDPSDWSENKLKTYLQDNEVPFAGEDRRRVLIKLVKQHQKIRERAAQDTSSASAAGPPPSETEPLLGAQRHESSSAATSANEHLERASNLRQ